MNNNKEKYVDLKVFKSGEQNEIIVLKSCHVPLQLKLGKFETKLS